MNRQFRFKCKNESIREDGSKIMQFTKGKEYEGFQFDSTTIMIMDDNGDGEEFFNTAIMFDEL